MTRWERPGVARPHAEDYEDAAVVHGFGGISTGHAYEVTEDEERELRKQRRRAEQRKRPPGFAPWGTS